MVVGILRVLHGVLDELQESWPLADKLDQFRFAASAAEHDELFLLKEEILDRAALFLVEELLDLHVLSTEIAFWL